MAERVAGGRFANAGPPHGVSDGTLEHGLMQVVAPPLAGHPIDVDPRRRENPLPSPLPAGVRILSHQRPRELDSAGAARQIPLMLTPHQLEMLGEAGFDRGGKHCHPIPIPLAGPHNDLA